MTATQSPPTEHPKTASDSAERRYATVNPFTGETEKEFDFTADRRRSTASSSARTPPTRSGASARSRSARPSSGAPPS